MSLSHRSHTRLSRGRAAGRSRTGVARLALLTLVVGCGDGPSSPPVDRLEADVAELRVTGSSATFRVTNTGDRAVGPVDLVASQLVDADGVEVPGRWVETTPSFISTLEPGASAAVVVRVLGSGTALPGTFAATVEARVDGTALADVRVVVEVRADDPLIVGGLEISAAEVAVRQGDGIPLQVRATDLNGAVLEGFTPSWRTRPAGAGIVLDGRFHPYRTGAVELIGQIGVVQDIVAFEVEPRGVGGRFEFVARGEELTYFTSDLWVYGDHAYLGTWGTRGGPGGVSGNTLFTWNVSGAPVRTAALQVEARTVNDVKVRDDGRLAVITHEGSDDGLNGFTLLDLANPAEPEPITRFTETLETGVHNVWIEGDWLYVVVDGPEGLRIVDISDPTAPRIAATYYAGSSFLHDVYVREGLAFLSHWDEGLIVLDVGNGIAGGSPETPVEIAHVPDLRGETHNTWYWPETGYLFIGEEDFGTPGIVHVVDFSDPRNPVEVANIESPGATPHNFWLDEDTGTLFVGWYGNGIQAFDVTGHLAGELDRQGRQLGGLAYDGSGGCGSRFRATCTWAPQLVDGRLFVSDRNRGLVELRWIRE